MRGHVLLGPAAEARQRAGDVAADVDLPRIGSGVGAIRIASSRAADSRSSRGTILLIRPSERASSALILSPVKSSSLVYFLPRMNGISNDRSGAVLDFGLAEPKSRLDPAPAFIEYAFAQALSGPAGGCRPRLCREVELVTISESMQALQCGTRLRLISIRALHPLRVHSARGPESLQRCRLRRTDRRGWMAVFGVRG